MKRIAIVVVLVLVASVAMADVYAEEAVYQVFRSAQYALAIGQMLVRAIDEQDWGTVMSVAGFLLGGETADGTKVESAAVGLIRWVSGVAVQLGLSMEEMSERFAEEDQ